MPNTPALIGRGITGAYANALVSKEQRAIAHALLASSGKVEWLATEDSIDAVTAVSGSGPAYIFHMAEVLASAGTQMGLEPDLAMRPAKETIAGAGEMMLRSDREPDELRRNVTSPNGTTARALDVLMRDGGLADLLLGACRAAELRAKELSAKE